VADLEAEPNPGPVSGRGPWWWWWLSWIISRWFAFLCPQLLQSLTHNSHSAMRLGRQRHIPRQVKRPISFVSSHHSHPFLLSLLSYNQFNSASIQLVVVTLRLSQPCITLSLHRDQPPTSSSVYTALQPYEISTFPFPSPDTTSYLYMSSPCLSYTE
jgi:hypothetical protein